MRLNIGKEVVALRHMSTQELLARYAELFGEDVWKTGNRVWLVRRIAWRLQALDEGDLTERARRRAAELANDADLRLSPPRPHKPRPKAIVQAVTRRAIKRNIPHLRPGTVLARKYRGEMLEVRVLIDGFAFEGTTYASLSAVALGLEWLALHQSKDGSWSIGKFREHAHERAADWDGKEFTCDCIGSGLIRADVAGTALALLPFLGAGFTHEIPPREVNRDYHKTIKAGIDFLLSKQREDGGFAGEPLVEMYIHGLATLALCEAYGMTSDVKLKSPAQKAIDFIVAAQHEKGGWRYKPKEDRDTSVTGWQIQALQAGKLAGFKVPRETWNLAEDYLEKVMKPGGSAYSYTFLSKESSTMTAVGMLARLELGCPSTKNEWRIGLRTLLETPPGATKNMYYYYHATQDFYQAGGDAWNALWNKKMREHLIETQDKGDDAKHPHQKGSWSPVDESYGTSGGRLMITSLSLLTLEVYYRYPRITEGKDNNRSEK